MEIDWAKLRRAAVTAMERAYAPYSRFPVGAAALVDDGRTVIGCNVENAAYGVVLCAECGVVSALHASGGGRLVALSCVDASGQPLMPCGRCRQLLWEHGGPELLVEADPRPLRMTELLPHAFDVVDLDKPTPVDALPARLREYRGRGTVFIHPDMRGGELVWTGYWERSSGPDEPTGILEEGPTVPSVDTMVEWGRARTDRVVVVDQSGDTCWAGPGDPPGVIDHRWSGERKEAP
ncbi:MAG TPA: cytidine deaminase [Micromonosporaceae bacterium]